MARIVFIATVLAFVMALGVSEASAGVVYGHGYGFEWFRDADGDGIPNGLDDDWTRPEDGTGYQTKNGFGRSLSGGNPGNDENGNIYRHQNRYRKGEPETLGDRLRIRLRLHDGTCK